MTDGPFQIGQRVELIPIRWPGFEATIREIGDEDLGLVFDYEARAPDVKVKFFPRENVRVLRPKRYPPPRTSPYDGFPVGAELFFRTTDYQWYADSEFRDITATLGPLGPVLDVGWHRIYSVLPDRRQEWFDPYRLPEGGGRFTRRLTADEWRRVETAFASIDFWSLWHDDAFRPEPHEEFEMWKLLVDDHGRQHEVVRCRRPTEIESLCRLLYDLAKQPGLTLGNSSSLANNLRESRESRMPIRRIVPNIVSAEPDLCRSFYVDFLGLEEAMNMGWIATYVSPDNPSAQVSVVRGDAQSPVDRTMSISVEVRDVDALHSAAVARRYAVLYPLTDEPWGVRRFHVADPNGVVVNVMSHLPPPAALSS